MSETNIYVKCKSCKYLSGPYQDVEMANIAARLHEAAWFPTNPFSQKHQAYFVNLAAVAEKATVPNMTNYPKGCEVCGMVESACECPSYDGEGNEL